MKSPLRGARVPSVSFVSFVASVALVTLVSLGLMGASACNSTGGDADCCPRSAEPAGCMDMGGEARSGCPVMCDFFCSTNWRVVASPSGCETWVYDTRAPTADETSACFPIPPGADGGGSDAAAASDAARE